MRKSIEILQMIEAKRKEMKAAHDAGDLEKVKSIAGEIENAKNELAYAQALEGAEPAGGVPVVSNGTQNKKAVLRAAFNKKLFEGVRGVNLGAMTEAEMNAAKVIMTAGEGNNGGTDAAGGYLIPKEFIGEIQEARSELIELKKRVRVFTVSSRVGSVPKAGAEEGTLTAFDENTKIASDKLDFSQIEFNCKSYGDLIPVSNELIADAGVDVVGFISGRFSKKAVNSENKKIIEILPTEGTAIKDYHGIITALNTKLKTAPAANAVILTNQNGFDWLDNLVDNDGRPVLTPSFADPKTSMLRGHEVVVMDNATLPNAGSAIPIYVVSLADYVAFFDRQGVAIAADSSAGFVNNVTILRVIERFDAQVNDSTAAVKLTYTPANA